LTITETSQPQQQSKEHWEIEFDRLEHHIKRALKHQDMYNLSDIKEKIHQGMFHIWGGKNSVIVTYFTEYPQYNALNILIGAGDYEELEKMLSSVELFAKHHGCRKIFLGGRKGWSRKLKHLGFEKIFFIEKEL
jgi:hypothetical protein